MVLGIVAGLALTNAAQAFDFSVSGLAGTGVTAEGNFTYTAAADGNSGSITVFLENTSDYSDPAITGARISGFAFNVPTIAGASIATIAGSDPTTTGDVQALGSAIPEGSAVNEAGWYGLSEYEGIKTPNAAGDFDFGVLNNSDPNHFINAGAGAGSGPAIFNYSDGADSTTFHVCRYRNWSGHPQRRGLYAALSSDVPGGGEGRNFAVRFQGIGPDDDSDLATVPLPRPCFLGRSDWRASF